jgi:hypothetical protein
MTSRLVASVTIGSASLLLLAPSGAFANTSASHGIFAAARWGGAVHAAGVGAAALPANISVVATGLNQPKKITIGPDGNLYVAESGLNTVPAGCTNGTQAACVDLSGAIAKVTPAGAVSRVVTHLPSVNSGPPGSAVGPSAALVVGGKLQITVEANGNSQTTGEPLPASPNTKLLDALVSAPLSGSPLTKEADLGAYNFAHPFPTPAPGNNKYDSNPYAVTPWDGGLAIADAAANQVLLYKNGALSPIATLPNFVEHVPAGIIGPTAINLLVDAVPTSLAVGPDGKLYIGELGGGPYQVGNTTVYKVSAPGAPLVTVATGLTMVGDIAFDQAGRLLVLTIDQKGLSDPGTPSGPTPGAITRITGLSATNTVGNRTVLASTGLEFPTGMAVAKDGSIYVSNWGILQGHNDPNLPPGTPIGGEVVRVASTSPADQLGASFGGYREGAADGGVFTFGSFGFYGSEGGTVLNQPVTGISSTPLTPGYWEVAKDGGIFTFGTAGFYGSTGAIVLNKPVVGMTPTPDGRGYYLVASDGGVFTFGDGVFRGSTGGIRLFAPVVGGATTPDGRGYFLFAADGGVFAFGDAVFHGSAGGIHLAAPVVGGAITPDGRGYYLFAADGGVFTFGDAVFHGSAGGIHLAAPVVGAVATPNGQGYYLVASDGGVFSFGNAVFHGSTGGLRLAAPVVGIG